MRILFHHRLLTTTVGPSLAPLPHSTAAARSTALVADYVRAVTSFTLINGRRIYVPLGQSELTALSELYNVRLQVSCIAAATFSPCYYYTRSSLFVDDDKRWRDEQPWRYYTRRFAALANEVPHRAVPLQKLTRVQSKTRRSMTSYRRLK